MSELQFNISKLANNNIQEYLQINTSITGYIVSIDVIIMNINTIIIIIVIIHSIGFMNETKGL